MAKRLSVKHRKMARKKISALRTGKAPRRHKVAEERSQKAMFKKIARSSRF